MDTLVRFIWEDIILGIVGWFGNNVLSIEILGVTLLGWIIGLLVVSGLAVVILSLKPSFKFGRDARVDAARRDKADTWMQAYRKTESDTRNRRL